MLIQCDDKIELVTEKTRTDGSGVKIGLVPEWREASTINRDEGGFPIIISYYDKYQDEYVSVSDFKDFEKNNTSEEIASRYTPCFEWVSRSKTIPDCYIRIRGNSIFLAICKLSFSTDENLFSSRYRKLLEALDEQKEKTFKYTNNGGSRPIEAMRQKLKRWFRLYEYEYDILITDAEIGKRVFDELKMTAKKVYETGLYMKGAGEKDCTTIKMYKYSDIFKIEITFRKNIFKKLGLEISDMTEQERCIESLRNEAIIEILKFKGSEAVKQLQFDFVTTNHILARIERIEAKQSAGEMRADRTDARVEALEKQLQEMKRLLPK